MLKHGNNTSIIRLFSEELLFTDAGKKVDVKCGLDNIHLIFCTINNNTSSPG